MTLKFQSCFKMLKVDEALLNQASQPTQFCVEDLNLRHIPNSRATGAFKGDDATQTHPVALEADVEWVVQLSLVVCSDVQSHRETVRRVHPCASRVERKLANLDNAVAVCRTFKNISKLWVKSMIGGVDKRPVVGLTVMHQTRRTLDKNFVRTPSS